MDQDQECVPAVPQRNQPQRLTRVQQEPRCVAGSRCYRRLIALIKITLIFLRTDFFKVYKIISGPIEQQYSFTI